RLPQADRARDSYGSWNFTSEKRIYRHKRSSFRPPRKLPIRASKSHVRDAKRRFANARQCLRRRSDPRTSKRNFMQARRSMPRDPGAVHDHDLGGATSYAEIIIVDESNSIIF